jgi:hypothetical protein
MACSFAKGLVLRLEGVRTQLMLAVAPWEGPPRTAHDCRRSWTRFPGDAIERTGTDARAFEHQNLVLPESAARRLKMRSEGCTAKSSWDA